MKKIALIFICSIIALGVLCQKYTPAYQSNTGIRFSNFIDGVKSAYVVFDDDFVKYVDENNTSNGALAAYGVIDYLKAIGISKVGWGIKANQPLNLESLCDQVIVTPSWSSNDSKFTGFKIKFTSCNGDVFRFDAAYDIYIYSNTNVRTAIQNKCMELYGYEQDYAAGKRLQLPAHKTGWTEETLKQHFITDGTDAFEGIYEATAATATMAKYKVGVLKATSGYNIIYFDGAQNYLDWAAGELKAKIAATATATLFKAEWKMMDKSTDDNAYLSFETGLMNVVFKGTDKTVFIKLYPTAADIANKPTATLQPGTGFAISSNGLIVTNSHVINGVAKILVRGVNGNFSSALHAKLVAEDKNNDLAIIQIDEAGFTSLGKIAYTINSKSSDLGSSVFVLGYPAKAGSVNDIKLRSGIINSKTGLQGDITCYQISAALQPANSGGPVFDVKGNLIAIANVKASKDESGSYAIKTSYLANLIDLLTVKPKFAAVNLLTGKPLSEQVKLLSKNVFIIEVSN